MNTEELLEQRILDELEELEDKTGEEKKESINNIEKLYKLKISNDELAISERKQIIELEKIDNSIKMDEINIKQSKKNKIVDTALKVLEIGAPLALYATFLNRGFKFEQTGIYGSNTFKNLIGKLKTK